MRVLKHLNPGPGIADFWTEFSRPNPYRWPMLAGAALTTASLFYLLSGNAQRPNLLATLILLGFASVAVALFIFARIRIKLGVLLLAMAISATMIWQFAKFHVVGTNPKPEVIWISTFAPGRTDAEIEASNIAAQKRQDKIDAMEAAQTQRRKDLYAALGRATGVDVDAMQKKIDAEQAKVDAEKAKQREQLLKEMGMPSQQPAPDAAN
ncbi:hypothetical protein [Tsuneonella mangrovi]|uniref:hypothetical protein n=1 Tax=Tsuneonella mangrovi TaxID=1982042 RepID=UPI000BA2A745|nr:hypothetical protein [Tsuneonella mangrovi]